MPALPLSRRSDSLLVLVDIQSRLLAAMPAGTGQTLLQNSAILLQAASLLAIPILITEQYPKGLGSTDSTLLQLLPPATSILEKTCFSCAQADNFNAALQNQPRPQIILAGMETHVCILQTALELQARGLQVFVVEDAVCSRNPTHTQNAMSRLRQSGAIITNTESVLFEWLGDAGHEQFRKVSELIR